VSETVWEVQREHLDCLHFIRDVPGLQVFATSESVWLRAEGVCQSFVKMLQAFPVTQYTLCNDGQLVEQGYRVPTARLPELANWQPLVEAVSLIVPTPAMPPRFDTRTTLHLVRSDRQVDSNLLVTSWNGWRDFATCALRIRLDRLSFVAHREGRALVRGTPLPPLPGTHYSESHGIAVPAGFAFSPAVENALLADTMELEQGDIVLAEPQGNWTRIHAGQFVKATRASVRATDEEMCDAQ